MPVLLGIAFLVVVILLAGGYLFLKRSKTPQTDDRTSKTALAPSLTDEKTGITMMLVAAGEFVFGSNANPGSPNAREVKNLPAYYIDQTEVSNAQYKKYCDETGAKPPDSRHSPRTRTSRSQSIARGRREICELGWQAYPHRRRMGKGGARQKRSDFLFSFGATTRGRAAPAVHPAKCSR